MISWLMLSQLLLSEIGTLQFGCHMLLVENQGRDLNKGLKLSIANRVQMNLNRT